MAKDPNAITFPAEIHRDGPGHLAVVDLPYGVEAADVIARRGRLASGLRLPLDQVWPEPAPGHTGRLALWVGHEPASQMRQPAWPLLALGHGGRVQAVPVRHHPRAWTSPMRRADVPQLAVRRPARIGQDVRAAAAGAGRRPRHPRAEMRGYELKGAGDFAPVEPVCAEYGNGNDDETLTACADMFGWLYGEGQKRAKRIAHYAASARPRRTRSPPNWPSLPGLRAAPAGGVRRRDPGAVHCSARPASEAGETAEKCIKLFRALGIMLLLGTQIPDKDSLPTGITRNINTRFCLSVADQVANDMILGTSRVQARLPGHRVRAGHRGRVGHPGRDRQARRPPLVLHRQRPGRQGHGPRHRAPRRRRGRCPSPRTAPARPLADVLADVAAVWPAGEDAAWNETLLERLTSLRPEVYGRWETRQLTTALSGYGVTDRADRPPRSTARPSTGAAPPAPTSSAPSPNVTETAAGGLTPAAVLALAAPPASASTPASTPQPILACEP